MFNIIIPAHNERALIGDTLSSLLDQDAGAPDKLHAVVAANGCTDDTEAVARSHERRFAERGWKLTVLGLPQAGKIRALNRAEQDVEGGPLVYLDADVICSPALLGQLAAALAGTEPRYASGTFTVAACRSVVSRMYARIWLKLPFMASGLPGAGLFAVNSAGRARWQAFPDLIADDLFVRLNFSPEERTCVPASFAWPLSETFPALVRVRRRWDRGNRQLRAIFPELFANEDKPTLSLKGHMRLFFGQPASYLVYAAVAVATRFKSDDTASWARGR